METLSFAQVLTWYEQHVRNETLRTWVEQWFPYDRVFELRTSASLENGGIHIGFHHPSDTAYLITSFQNTRLHKDVGLYLLADFQYLLVIARQVYTDEPRIIFLSMELSLLEAASFTLFSYDGTILAGDLSNRIDLMLSSSPGIANCWFQADGHIPAHETFFAIFRGVVVRARALGYLIDLPRCDNTISVINFPFFSGYAHPAFQQIPLYERERQVLESYLILAPEYRQDPSHEIARQVGLPMTTGNVNRALMRIRDRIVSLSVIDMAKESREIPVKTLRIDARGLPIPPGTLQDQLISLREQMERTGKWSRLAELDQDQHNFFMRVTARVDDVRFTSIIELRRELGIERDLFHYRCRYILDRLRERTTMGELRLSIEAFLLNVERRKIYHTLNERELKALQMISEAIGRGDPMAPQGKGVCSEKMAELTGYSRKYLQVVFRKMRASREK